MSINIKKNVLLAPYTTFKIGGPAKFFTEIKSEKEIMEALKYAQKNNLKYFILGGGSNILISDKGFDGLVMKLQITDYDISNGAEFGKDGHATKISCGAGTELPRVVMESVKNSLTGLEWAVGIPGTIGGAVRGNTGAFGSCMADITKTVKVLEIPDLKFQNQNQAEIHHELQGKTYNNQECDFSYRSSIFKERQNIIILSVVLKLKKGDIKKSQREIKNIILKRKGKQPQFPSAGSYFKNPIVSDKKIIEKFEDDSGLKIKDDKIPAGWFIEEAGFRGKKIGGAQVSYEHGNFIINTGKAKAEDVIMLASIIKQKIRSVFNVQLMEEVQLVGF